MGSVEADARGPRSPPGTTLSEDGQLTGTPTGDPVCTALQILVTHAADQHDRQSDFVCVVQP